MSVITVIREVFWLKLGTKTLYHRLNMELDRQSLFGLLCTAVFIVRDPATPPSSPLFGLIYEGAIGQPR
jgi:hypothetical protein